MSANAKIPKERYWEKKIEATAKALRANRFGASIHADAKEAARHLVDDMLTKDWKGSVNFGGSATVSSSGVVELLRGVPGAEIIPTWDGIVDPQELAKLRRERYICDLYLASSNAVTVGGQLLNIDGTGNRIASIHYGPNKVALFVGRNKICENIEEANTRARQVAAPTNAMRLNRATPCAQTGRCVDCKSPARICNVWTITEKCGTPERIHILLINEDLGF